MSLSLDYFFWVGFYLRFRKTLSKINRGEELIISTFHVSEISVILCKNGIFYFANPPDESATKIVTFALFVFSEQLISSFLFLRFSCFLLFFFFKNKIICKIKNVKSKKVNFITAYVVPKKGLFFASIPLLNCDLGRRVPQNWYHIIALYFYFYFIFYFIDSRVIFVLRFWFLWPIPAFLLP